MMFKLTTDAVDHYLSPPDVHEVNRENAPGAVMALVFAVLLTIAHGINVYCFAFEGTPVIIGLVMHIFLVVITAIIVRSMVVQLMDSRFPVLLLVSTTFMSVFGAAGTMLAIVFYLVTYKRATSFIDWFKSIFPSREATTPEQVYDDIIIGRDESSKSYNVMPFLEVMDAGSEAQKREALSKMTLMFHPNFAPAFKKALQDPSNTIRVQAATAITLVENQFQDRLMKLNGVYVRYPNDPLVVRALAELYDAYAFTGILDAEREQMNRTAALKHYREYLRLKPEDETARQQLGRVLLRSGQANEAADWFREALSKGSRNEALKLWYAEALFASGRYQELRGFVASHAGLGRAVAATHPAIAEALELWTNSNKGAIA